MCTPHAIPTVNGERASYSTDFWNHMKTGYVSNSLSEESDPAGGYLVPTTYDGDIIRALREKNFMRRICVSVPTEKKLIYPKIIKYTTAQWVSENQPYVESDMEFGEIVLDAYKLTDKIIISEELMADSGIDLEKFILSEFSESFADAEEEAFLVGDGDGKPTGVVNQAQIGCVSQAKNAITVDDLINLTYSVPGQFRNRSVFVMSTDAYTKMRMIKTAYGKYMWQDDVAEGDPNKLLNYDVYVSKHLDSVEGGKKPVLFGDFTNFVIGDRGKRMLKRLDEKYADQGQIGFIMSERVDGKLLRTDAVKSLQVKA